MTRQAAENTPLTRSEHRLVFVGGLHRSGTTLMTNLLAAHPSVSGLSGTSVPEDEGQHLQDVYASARAHGGPGRFAFAAAAHLTEVHAEKAEAIRRRLFATWAPYWNLSRPVLVEKSPPNMLMIRFLHSIFPQATFVMLIRHPVVVSIATQKWSHTRYGPLVRHWLVANETMFADIVRLARVSSFRRVIVVRYEDLTSDPCATLEKVLAAIDLPTEDAAGIVAVQHVASGINAEYFTQWREGAPLWKPAYTRIIEARYGARVRQLSYDLKDPSPLEIRSLCTALRGA